jgi:hypothetical protein
MWIFSESFLSIVADKFDPDVLVVRARVEGDIERYFPNAAVLESAGSDYRYRASIPRKDVIITVARMIFDIDYPNYKSSLSDHRRSPWYMTVWDSMWRMQEALR